MDFLLIGIVAALLIFYTFLNTPQGRGWLGETRVKLIIGKTKSECRYVINNLVIKVDENKTSQIDHVLINENGIFVIETKNYSGRIYGRENQLEWTQVLKFGKVKNKLYNPIKQNKSHIYHVSQLLNNNLPLTSAVVFVQGNTGFIEADGVYTLKELKKLINEPQNAMTPEQMKEAYDLLSAANDKTVKNSEHVRNIREMKQNVENNICPRCGKQLVERQGKNGAFFGCSGYPSCRFIKKK